MERSTPGLPIRPTRTGFEIEKEDTRYQRMRTKSSLNPKVGK